MENGRMRNPKTGQFAEKNELPAVVISLRVSAAEYARLKELAARQNLTTSQLMHQLAISVITP